MKDQEKIVSLVDFRSRQKNLKPAANLSWEAPEVVVENPDTFNTTMKKNETNQERLRRERLKANQSVLKSYRIKH